MAYVKIFWSHITCIPTQNIFITIDEHWLTLNVQTVANMIAHDKRKTNRNHCDVILPWILRLYPKISRPLMLMPIFYLLTNIIARSILVLKYMYWNCTLATVQTHTHTHIKNLNLVFVSRLMNDLHALKITVLFFVFARKWRNCYLFGQHTLSIDTWMKLRTWVL